MLNKEFKTYKLEHFILPLLVVLSGVIVLKDYFFPSFQIILGLLIAPFIFRIREKASFSDRYFYIAVLCLVLYYILCMKLFLFLGVGSLLLHSIESRFGKTGVLPFIFLICISPALHYVVNTLTFTLRLTLSQYSADLLNCLGYTVKCHGNYFVLPDGFTFNVDKACLGLNMFNTGLGLTCLMAGLIENKKAKVLNLVYLLFAFITAAGLLIVANFLRIVLIVVFKSAPGTVSHEMIGMSSLIFYMALPTWLLLNGLVQRYGELPGTGKRASVSPPSWKLVFPILSFAFLFFSFTNVERSLKTEIKDCKVEKLSFPGFAKSRKEDGVMEYKKDSILIYVKPASRFFESDHPPALCWIGAGFEVEEVTIVKVLSYKVMQAVIKKGKIIQYTAWWYDNGRTKTVDQWTWRLAKGEPFRIINITANNKEDLRENCEAFLKKKIF